MWRLLGHADLVVDHGAAHIFLCLFRAYLIGSVLAICSIFLFLDLTNAGLDVARDTEEHVLTQLCNVNWLVALIDDVWIALLTKLVIKDGIMAHTCFDLLTTLVRSGLLKLNHLL